MSFDFQPENQRPVEYEESRVPLLGSTSVVVLTLFVGVIAVLFFQKPAGKAFKTFWAHYHARDAVEALNSENFGHAIAEIIEARAWAPEDPEVIRAVIQYLNAVDGDPRELTYQIRVLAKQVTPTAEEQVIYGQALLALGQVEEARGVYEKLSSVDAEAPEALRLLSKIHAVEGQNNKADEITRKAIELEKKSEQGRLAAALENRAHSFPEFRERSWKQLWDLAQDDGKTGIEAVQEIAKDSRLTFEQAGQLLDIVQSHPHKSMMARLAVVDAIIRLRPLERSRLIQQEVDRFQNLKEGSLIELAAWLSAHREHSHLLKVLPQNLVADSRPLYTSVIKALVGQGRWQDIKTMIKEGHPPVSHSLSTLWLADAESHLQPDLLESRRLIAFVIDSASMQSELEELELACGLASKLDMLDLVLKAQLKLAAAIPARKGEFLLGARESARLTKQTRVLLEVSRELLKLNPSNTAYADQLTYFRLLLGEEMETIDPAAIQHSSILAALAAYRFSDRGAMTRRLGAVPSTDGLPAGQRAVIAGMLATSGDQARAFQIAEKIPAALLLDEERLFLKRAQ